MAPLILVVDDNPAITNILKMILEMEGYIVHTAGSGEECLAQVSRERPGLILLDIVMSPMDGWTVVERIRIDSENDAIPILMVTAKPPTREEAEKYSAFVDGYIMKPFDLAVLKRTIGDILSERAKMEKMLGKTPEKEDSRRFLEEYCRLARIVRAQEAFSSLLAQQGMGRDEAPTPEAVRLQELKGIIQQVAGISETGE